MNDETAHDSHDGNGGSAPPDTSARNDASAKPLAPGAIAPGFSLAATPDQRLTLAELRGRPVILAFYPADWSPVCGDQLALYNQILPEFRKFGAELIGISVDGVWCHRAFAEDRHIHFPLLADFEPKGAVANAYGVYRAREGTSERALYVIDGDGKVHWSYVSPVGVNPGADGILDALESLARKTRPADIPPAPFIGRRTEETEGRESRGGVA